MQNPPQDVRTSEPGHPFGKLTDILKALSVCAEHLLQQQSWEVSAPLVLARLGRAVGVSRTYLFEYRPTAEAPTFMTQRFEWVAEGITAQIDNPELLSLPLSHPGFGHWFEAHRQGLSLHGLVEGFPPAIRAVLDPQDIISIAVVPVMIQNHCWGFIGFDDCIRRRDWAEHELVALKLAADIFAGAIKRQTEEQARSSAEERYRWLVEQSNDVITRCTPDGRYIFVSDSIRRHTGFEPEELLGRDSLDSIHPDDRERVMALAARGLAGEDVGAVEFRRVCKDGSYIWGELTGTFLRDPSSGRIVEMVTHFRNIQQRKAAEEALKASEERYRSVVRAQSELICRFNPDTTLTFVNDSYADFFKMHRSQLIGRSFLELVPEGEHNGILEHIQTLIETDRSSTYEHLVIRDDGEVRRQQWTDSVIRDSLGNVIELQSVGRDITERWEMENALRRSEARFRSVFENSGEGIFIYSVEHHSIVQANPSMARMLGVDVKDLLGRSPSDFAPENEPDVERLMAEQLSSPDAPPIVRERRYTAADGRTVWARINATRMEGDDDKTRRILFVVSDVTEEVLAQHRLEKSEAEYRRVAESNRRLLSEVNHRTKNNLAGIIGLISMTAHHASDVSTFAGGLQTRILSMARVHEMLSQAEWRDLDLRSIAGRIIETLGSTLTFQPQISLSGPAVEIAPRIASPLALVFQELFTNSVKHGAFKATDGRVTLQWSRGDQSIGIIWKEQAPGHMPPLDHAMKPGVGLQLIRGLIEHEIGGQVAFDSSLEGLLIRMELPISEHGDSPAGL